MDAGQLATLRQWAEGLSRDDRPEVRAAARAILMLADEVESLRATLLTEMPANIESAGEAPAELEESEHGPVVERDLRARLRTFARSRLSRP